MWPMEIVGISPALELNPCVLDRCELVDVEELTAMAPIEQLYATVFSGVPRTDEVELHAAHIGPVSWLEDFGSQFSPVPICREIGEKISSKAQSVIRIRVDGHNFALHESRDAKWQMTFEAGCRAVPNPTFRGAY